MTPNAAPEKKRETREKKNTKLPLNLIHTVALTRDHLFSGRRKHTHTHLHSFFHLTSLPSNVFIKIPPFVTFHLVLPFAQHDCFMHYVVYIPKCVSLTSYRFIFIFIFLWLFFRWFVYLCSFFFCSVMKMSKNISPHTEKFTRFNFVPINVYEVSFFLFFFFWMSFNSFNGFMSEWANDTFNIYFEIYFFFFYFFSLNSINLFGF